MADARVSVLLALLSVGACKREVEPEPVSGATPPTMVIEQQPEPGVPNAPFVWVAGGGVHAYDLDGQRVASFSEVGDHAIRLKDGRVVVLVDRNDGNSLIVVDAEGTPGAEVRLPNDIDPATCSGRVRTGEDAEMAPASWARSSRASSTAASPGPTAWSGRATSAACPAIASGSTACS